MTSNNPTKRLFVGSLPYRFTEGELLDLFIQYGKIIAVRIVKNRWGKSRGMGYVEFEDIDCAINAKNRLHDHLLQEGRTIIVDFAQPDPFETPEGKQRHIEAQESRPVAKRRFLDNFGNRKPLIEPVRPEPSRRRFGGSPREEQISQGGFSNRDDSRSLAGSPSKSYSGRKYKGGKPVFNVLGRSLNKDKSEEYVPKFRTDAVAPKKRFKPAPGQKPEYKGSDPHHVRGSIFKQRKFGSKVGAKFAFKSKKSR